MNARQGLLLIAGFFGFCATLMLYLLLFFVQIQNADNACESPSAALLGDSLDDLRGIGFENSYLNLGGRCAYHMGDGSVVHTREPGWWFSGSIAGFVAAFAGLVGAVARWRNRRGWPYGLISLVAPPLGFALAIAAPRKAPS